MMEPMSGSLGAAPTARRFSRADLDGPVEVIVPEGRAVAFAHRSPVKQSANEDSVGVAVSPGGGLVLAVADGCGGYAGAAEASGATIECLLEHVAGASAGELRSAVVDALEEAERRVVALGVGAATTFAAAVVEDGAVRSIHAGDAEVLVVGQRGRVKHRTLAHSPVAQALDGGFLDEQEALAHEDRVIVSNTLGAGDLRIEIGPSIRLARRDSVLVSSDGVFDNLTLEEVADLVRVGDPVRAVERLVAAARERMEAEGRDEGVGHADDLGLVLYRPG